MSTRLVTEIRSFTILIESPRTINQENAVALREADQANSDPQSLQVTAVPEKFKVTSMSRFRAVGIGLNLDLLEFSLGDVAVFFVRVKALQDFQSFVLPAMANEPSRGFGNCHTQSGE